MRASRRFARARDTSRLAYRAGAVSLIEALDAERAAVATFRALGGGYKAS